MLGHNAFLSYVFIIGCVLMSQLSVANNFDGEIYVTNKRNLKGGDRIYNEKENCASDLDSILLYIKHEQSLGTNYSYFQLENRGAHPIYINLLGNSDGYRIDYPFVELIYMSDDDQEWKKVSYSSGDVDVTGLEKVAVLSGDRLTFKTPIGHYLSGLNASFAKLKIRIFYSPSDSVEKCILSGKFGL